MCVRVWERDRERQRESDRESEIESEWERETLYDTVFMGGVKVKASGCAVIVGDVLIKAFWEGFHGVTACGVQSDPTVTGTHTDWHVCVCVFVSVVQLCSCLVSSQCAAVLIPDGQRLAAYRSKCFHKHVEMTYGVFVCVCLCVSHTEAERLYLDDGVIDTKAGQAPWNTSVILPT